MAKRRKKKKLKKAQPEHSRNPLALSIDLSSTDEPPRRNRRRDRLARSPLLHLQFYIELPFDAGLPHGAFNAIEMTAPPIEDWADFDLQAFLGMPELPNPVVRPCVVLRFRRVTVSEPSPFNAVLAAYPEELGALLRRPSTPGLSKRPITIVKAERIVPASSPEFGQTWLHDQFMIVLDKLNLRLLALGAAAGDHHIRPVHPAELPPVVLGWQHDLRDLGDSGARPRPIFLALSTESRGSTIDHDAETINHAIAISDHLGHGPFGPTMEFIFAARRSLEGGRAAHAIIESGTAVELLVDGVVRGILLAQNRPAERIENILLRTPFRSRYVDHFARAFGVSVTTAAPPADPINRWIQDAYELRNRVAHLGHKPTDQEAADALAQAWSLVELSSDQAAINPTFGITFPSLASLVPHPELDERSLAVQGATSANRLARDALREGVSAFNRGDRARAIAHFSDAAAYGSGAGAFNVAMSQWIEGDLDGAVSSLELAIHLNHRGAPGYLGLHRFLNGEMAEAERLFRLVGPRSHARAWPLAAFFLATILAQRDKKQEAAELYREAAIIESFSLAAEASLRRGILLHELGDVSSVDALAYAVQLGNPEAALEIVKALVSEGLLDQAIAMCQRALEQVASWEDLPADVGYGLSIVFESPTRSLAQKAAQAVMQLADALLLEDRGEDALTLCDDAVGALAQTAASATEESQARVLLCKSAALGGMGRHDAALSVTDDLVERLAGSTDSELLELATTAQSNRAAALLHLGRLEDALDAYEESLRQSRNRNSEIARFQSFHALLGMAALLRELGRTAESSETYDAAFSVVNEITDPTAQDLAVLALASKAELQVAQEEMDAALDLYTEIERHLGDRDDVSALERLAWIGINRGVALERLSHKGEALASYDAVIDRFGDSDVLNLRLQVVTALVHKGILLGELGHLNEALATTDEVEQRLQGSTDSSLQAVWARALVNKAVALVQLGRTEEALEVDDYVIASFPKADASVARAMVNRSAALETLNRMPEAISTCDSVVQRFGAGTDRKLCDAVAVALLNKGEFARKAGDEAAASEAYHEVIRRFADLDNPILMGRVAAARRELTPVETRSGDPDQGHSARGERSTTRD